MLSNDTIAQVAYRDLSLPMCMLDEAGRLVDLNARALAYWGLAPDACGRLASDALRLAGPAGEPDGALLLGRAVRTGTAVAAAVRHGEALRPVALIGAPVRHGCATLTVLIVLNRDQPDATLDGALPARARTDPETGLVHREGWHDVAGDWDGAPGAAIWLRLDRLKWINDRRGRTAGDALLAALGAAVRAAAPTDGLAVRLEGNAFALLLPRPDVAEAEAWLAAAKASLGAATAPLELPSDIRHGVATWHPGGLAAALEEAAVGLHDAPGLALSAVSGGRIVLQGATTASPAGLSPAIAAATGVRPGGSLDYYPQWREQAKHFVAFAAPPAGGAVVEVGAGAGRITFDGGLARQVGAGGVLLVTDPDPSELERARMRAHGMPWIHFLCAAAEALPVASGTVDMVAGALFLHLSDQVRAVREMARLLRPGGRLALAAALEFEWSPFWTAVLEPIRVAQAAAGRPLPQPLLAFGQLEAILRDAGLVLERAEVSPRQQFDMRNVPTAIAVWRRLSIADLLLRGLGPSERAGVRAECETRLVAGFAGASVRMRALEWRGISVVARRPL